MAKDRHQIRYQLERSNRTSDPINEIDKVTKSKRNFTMIFTRRTFNCFLLAASAILVLLVVGVFIDSDGVAAFQMPLTPRQRTTTTALGSSYLDTLDPSAAACPHAAAASREEHRGDPTRRVRPVGRGRRVQSARLPLRGRCVPLARLDGLTNVLHVAKVK